MEEKRYPDSRKLTEAEREKLCKMIYYAFVEIRILGWHGKSEQSADLADVFHNLPILIYRDDFRFHLFSSALQSYQNKYSGSVTFNYLNMLNEIVQSSI